MKKVLITGIAGFTGGHLVEYISKLDLEIFGLDLPSSNADFHNHLKHVSKIYYDDIRDENAISKIIRSIKPDYVFHLAGLIVDKDLKDFLEINVLGTKNILDAVQSIHTKVLIPGSGAEYGAVPKDKLPITEMAPLCPITNYGLSKVTQILLARQYFFRHGCHIYVARPFNIIGPGEPESLVCSALAKQIVDIENKDLEPVVYVGNLDTKRDFIDVRDVVKAYWAIINKGNPGEIYNVCSSKAYSIKNIVSDFLEISKVKLQIKQDPKRVRTVDIPIHVGENKKIRDSTGWFPEISINKTLNDLLEYHRHKSNSQ